MICRVYGHAGARKLFDAFVSSALALRNRYRLVFGKIGDQSIFSSFVSAMTLLLSCLLCLKQVSVRAAAAPQDQSSERLYHPLAV